MNLFEDIELENHKYINVIEALELVARKINYKVSDVARRLLLDGFNKVAPIFNMNSYEKIEIFCSERDFSGNYLTTTEFLELAISTLGTFEYIKKDSYGNEYQHIKEDWVNTFWLKSDFFNYSSIKKIGVTEKFYNEILELDSEMALHDFIAQRIECEDNKKAKENSKKISINFLKEVEQFEAQKQIDNISTQQRDYKFFLFKKPLLTFHEASCIMTGYNPMEIKEQQNANDFEYTFTDYVLALDYIKVCTDAQILGYDSYSNRIVADEFKQFLANNDTFIVGFNNSSPVQDIKPFLQQKELNIENNEIEYENLRKFALETNNELLELMQVKKNLDDTIFHLNNTMMGYVAEKSDLNEEIDQLKMQLERKNTEIALLKQSVIQTNPPNIKNESRLRTREENNIIKVLAVLADMEKKIDISKPYEAHGIMKPKAELLGIEAFPSDESIKKWFIKATEYKNPN